jgi:hypothetical protein
MGIVGIEDDLQGLILPGKTCIFLLYCQFETPSLAEASHY